LKIALYQKSGATKGPQTEVVAEMMYKLAQPQLESYLAMEIKGAGPGATAKAEDKALTDSLSKKTRGLVEVDKTFTEIVALGAGEWGLAALVSLGKAYEDMATELRTSAPPAHLTPEQVEIYRMQLEDRAYVPDEKAVNAYKTALQKSFELTLYNENTAYATRQLGVLRPDEYPGLSETLLEPRWTSSKSGKTYSYETSL
jgi:cellulose synthase operon protein C